MNFIRRHVEQAILYFLKHSHLASIESGFDGLRRAINVLEHKLRTLVSSEAATLRADIAALRNELAAEQARVSEALADLRQDVALVNEAKHGPSIFGSARGQLKLGLRSKGIV